MKRAFITFIAVSLMGMSYAQELTVTYQATYDTSSPELFAEAGLPEETRASLAAAYKDVVMNFQLVVKGDESEWRVLPGEGKQEIKFMGQTIDINAAIAMQARNYTYKNHAEGISMEKTQVLGKNFIVTDSIQAAKFSVVEGEKKDILGYECLKAVSQDGKTTAWYSPQIPISDEPIATGLEGLVLGFDNGQQIFTATKIENTADKQPVRPEGKDTITKKDFTEWVKKRTEMMRRN